MCYLYFVTVQYFAFNIQYSSHFSSVFQKEANFFKIYKFYFQEAVESCDVICLFRNWIWWDDLFNDKTFQSTQFGKFLCFFFLAEWWFREILFWCGLPSLLSTWSCSSCFGFVEEYGMFKQNINQGSRLTFQLASPVACDRFDSPAKTDFSLARCRH